MGNISTVIGAVVGVFIALLVGLALFGEITDSVATIGTNANLDSFIATRVILNILPTVILVGLLAAGGVIGMFIGRATGSRLA